MFRTVRLCRGATLFMFSQVSQQLFVHIFFPFEKNMHLLDTHQMSDYQQGSSYTVNAK